MFLSDIPEIRKGIATFQKILKSQFGEFQVDIPRDRNREFGPKLISKYQRDVSDIEEQVISLYERGMSTRDIHDQLNDIYRIEMSAEMVSHIKDQILAEIKQWQARPLNPLYPFVFMGCIHYKVREGGILSRPAYVVLRINASIFRKNLLTFQIKLFLSCVLTINVLHNTVNLKFELWFEQKAAYFTELQQ